MKITIKSLHFSASTQLEAFVEKKVSKLEKLMDSILEVEVTLKLVKPETNNNKEVFIKISIAGNDLLAEKVADTFEEATDLAVTALEKQIVKLKEKNRK